MASTTNASICVSGDCLWSKLVKMRRTLLLFPVTWILYFPLNECLLFNVKIEKKKKHSHALTSRTQCLYLSEDGFWRLLKLSTLGSDLDLAGVCYQELVGSVTAHVLTTLTFSNYG